MYFGVKKFELLEKISVKNRLILLIILTGITLSVASGIIFYLEFKNSLYKEKETQIAYLTEVATNLLSEYKQRIQSGELAEEDAKQRAIKRIGSLNFDDDNYIWINDYNGIMLSHPKKELLGTSVLEMKDKDGDYIFQEFIKIAKEKGKGKYEYDWNKPGQPPNKTFPKLSYVRGDNDWGWVVGTGIYIDDIKQQLLEALISIVVSSIILLFFVIFIAYQTIGKSIIQPLQDITEISSTLATNDLTVNIPKDDNQTEIGEMNRSFKKFVENLKILIQQTASSVEQVDANSKQIHIASDQTAHGAQQVAMSISQLAEGTNQQATDVSISLENVEIINKTIKNISSNSQNTLKLAQNTQTTANESKKYADEAILKINQIEKNSVEVSKIINQLGKMSNEIGQIVDLIKNVANQTNLLALNAAIEAARAGEHGKGFAVVAEEVKTLASQSAQASDNITAMIKEIQKSITTAVKSMDESVSEVKAGTKIVEDTGHSLVEIVEAARTTYAQIKEISSEIDSLSQNSEKFVGMMENISSVIEESAASTEEIASVSEEQSATLQQINASSADLAKMSEDLKKQIAIFKI